jgi:hypothetical protein
MAAIPGIRSAYEFGNELLSDDFLDKEEKDEIENDMEDMGDGFKDLKQDVNDEHQRYVLPRLLRISLSDWLIARLVNKSPHHVIA